MWRIWYDNGSSFSDEDGPPELAPGRGVICIVQDAERTGRVKLSGADYYIWKEGQWFRADLFGLWDYLVEPGHKKVVFGRTVARHLYNQILRQAEADDRFPRRSAWEKWEHRV
jgi:hypothetical protein